MPLINGNHGDGVATNGLHGRTGQEINLAEGETFLFTSESVGEGHPGNQLFY